MNNFQLTLENLRHSTAHIMAQAVKRLYPGVKLAIGPSISDGFYYDFDLEQTITPEDLARIEHEMRDIINADLPFESEDCSKAEAQKKLQHEPYKLELLTAIPDAQVTFYRDGEFTDLCRGPHLARTSQVKAFKLLKVSGAYWRGDETRPMLQRIYGIAFFNEAELADYLNRQAEAEKRDHRRLGKELELFSIFEAAGPGLVYYQPRGAILRQIVEDFTRRENIKRGYQHVITPQIANGQLWHRSGHYDYYRDNIFFSQVDEQEYVIKPMNCPGHILIYESKTRSYRDLPLRLAEFGTVYRYERSGVLHGLLRVRGFTQDDAHIFCTPEQLAPEIEAVLDYADFMMRTFGFAYKAYLSTRPEKSVGSDENWEKATQALETGLITKGLAYEKDPGEGVFYGPKIDIKFADAIGRTWQGPTIQVDFNLAERFDISYIGEDGAKHRPVMIHRVVLGSLERFLGALIEHYAGAFPLWLAPVQVKILTISDEVLPFAKELVGTMLEREIRVESDLRSEKIGQKIRHAQLEQVPYMVIIGKKEQEKGLIAVRERRQGDLGQFSVTDFLAMIQAQNVSGAQ